MSDKHTKLFIPGPVEVRKEILEAQAEWMIGHRSKDFAALYARLQPKLQQSFATASNRVYVYTSSGSGVWESASRNCIRDDQSVLHLVAGAFSDRWAGVSEENGKKVVRIEAEWGQAIKPEVLVEALKIQRYDAVACVYNETSTGVLHPLAEYAEIVKKYPQTLLLVDTVSAYLGTEVLVDEWGIDVCLTSSQKALALPPGIAFGAVSDRTLERAKEVKNRGYYFDMLTMEKHHVKDNTPATPPISLMFAADKQLDDVFTEGLPARFARHTHMQQMTHDWARRAGFELYAETGYESPTLTTVKNTKGIDISALNKFLKENYHMNISNGYGKIKDETFRISHMGDLQPADMEALFTAMDDFLARG